MRPSEADEARVIHAMDIDDSYHVERVLARGPRGATELVTHGGVGPFVRKRMPAKLANRAVWAMLADCSCPRLPQVQTTFETPDEFVVVYEFVEGDTLAQLVGQKGRLTTGEALPILREVCEAVAALHAHGIVHRDITPTNIILAADGAHLIDLGIARFVGGAGDAKGAAAGQDEVPLGTWGLAAPEQHGFASTDVRSDVYSLGRVLAFALTGIMPKSEGFDRALADEWLVPPAIARVIGKACEFEPSARYQSVGEFMQALDGARARHVAAVRSAVGSPACGETGSAAPQGACAPGAQSETPGASPRPASRRRGTALLAVGLTALVLAVACLAWWMGGRTPIDERPQDSGEEQAQLGASLDEPDGSDGVSDSADIPKAQGLLSGLGGGGASDSLDSDFASDPADRASSAGMTLASGESLVDQAVESLEIVETGYSTSLHGFVNTVVGIRNTSDDLLIELPFVRVTGRDGDGTIVSNDELGTSTILPGQTIYLAWPAGGGNSPETLEFSLVRPSDYNVSRWNAGSPEYVLSNVAEVQGTQGLSFTGEVTLAGDLSVLQAVPYIYGLRVVVVLRDGDGNPIGGRDTSVSIPEEGETVPFTIDMFDNMLDYASYEVYAYLA